ncbi:hypothetical protein EST92_26360 [Streptomyces sp. TM32]|uniref:hypothetical protein n=1 Tax=Streptomyces sp. TM32 TaxID=1652669 RepID=UPI0010102A96|nr:hypothetical protein [Streptomyces sp. TM32]RXS68759.1 hypothetical protein EST92_26360 [Streptomyces sp. TM32]
MQIEAQRPRVDSRFMGVATASGLVAIFLGLVVALLVVQLLARYADRRIARLRDPDGDSGSVTARSAAGLTAFAALGSYLLFCGLADGFGSGVPFWSVPLLAVLAHVPDAAKWRASATAARVVSAAAALAFPVCVLVAMGR